MKDQIAIPNTLLRELEFQPDFNLLETTPSLVVFSICSRLRAIRRRMANVAPLRRRELGSSPREMRRPAISAYYFRCPIVPVRLYPAMSSWRAAR